MNPDHARPLFIPLRAEFFAAFASGQKAYEYRRRGPRWNAETCTIGRRVVLSRGYGKSHRLTGKITGFHYETDPSKLPGWVACYGHGAGDASCIRIAVDLSPTPSLVEEPAMSNPKTTPTVAEPAGSGRRRRCQWLLQIDGWDDCGAPATHVRPELGLAYCSDHARLMAQYAALMPIPDHWESLVSNTKASDAP